MKNFLLTITAIFSFSFAFSQFCDEAQAGPGFPSDPTCEASICAADPFCCDNSWDGICASDAETNPACSGCLSTAGPAPTCPNPTTLTATNITNDAADLGWTSAETTFDVELGTAGFAPTGTPTDAGVANPFSVSSLSAATTYEYYVRADCGGGDLSSWSGPFSFTTQPNPPACGGQFFDNGGPAGNYLANSNETTTICPDVPGDVVTVTFTSFATETNWDALYVYDGADAAAPQIASTNGTTSGGFPAGGFYGTGLVNAPVGGTVTSTDASGCLTFVFRSDGSFQLAGWEADVTCAPPPACPNPTSLNATNITLDQADLGWTSTGSLFDIELGTAGFVPTETPTDAGVSNPFTAIGLTSATAYEYYVRQDCGVDGVSDWVGPFAFSTAALGETCGAPIVITTLPYTTTDNTSNYGDNYSATDRPVLGGEQVANGTGSGSYLNGDDVVYEFTPSSTGCYNIDLTGIGTWVGLWLFEGCDPFTSIVGYHTSTTSDPRSLPFLNLTAGTTYYIVISTWPTPQSTPYTLTVEECPSCIAPTNLTATNITNDAADLGWTSAETTFDVEFGTAGFAPTGTPTDAGVANPFSVSSLSAATTYEYYVRADCGGGDLSSWSGPFSFTTQPNPPACGGQFFDNGGPAGAYLSNSNETTTICPDVVGDVVTVTFISFATETNWDALYVYDGADATAPQIASTNGTTSGGFPAGGFWGSGLVNAPGEGAVTSTDASGCLTFVFRSDGSAQLAGWEADVTCAPPPTCPAPTALTASNVTNVSADLGWTSAETTFDVELGLSGFTPTGTPTDAGVSNPFTASGLSGATIYEFYVRADCGGGDLSSWSGPFSFTTDVSPPECGGNFVDIGGVGSPYLANANETTTICPDVAGDVVTVTFTSFAVETNWDALYVYDGADATAPQIATTNGTTTSGFPAGGFYGTGLASSPGTVTSTDASGCLTFVFRSDGSVQLAGWTADITCGPPPVGFVWTGTANNDWNNPANWLTSVPPNDCASNVFIQNTGFSPIVESVVLVGDFETADDVAMGIDLAAGGEVVVCGDMTLGDNFVQPLVGAFVLDATGGSGQNIDVNGSAEIQILFQVTDYNLNSGELGIFSFLILEDNSTFTNAGGNLVLLSDAGGTGVLVDFPDAGLGNAGGTYVGDITVQRFVTPGSGTGQRLFGSAVQNGQILGLDQTYANGANAGNSGYVEPSSCSPVQLAPFSPYSNLFQWNEDAPFTTGCYQEGWFALPQTTPLESGRAYSGWMVDGTTLSVSGVPNTGNTSFVTTGVTTGLPLVDGWHALSNPFPSPLNVNSVFASGFTSPQIYDGASGPFEGTYFPALVAGDFLGVMQGFFAESSTGATFTALQSDRTADATVQWLSGESPFTHMLEVSVIADDKGDKTFLYYSSNTTDQFDVAGDCVKKDSELGRPTLYTSLEGEQMSLNGYAIEDIGRSIPMGLKATFNGTHELSFDGMESFPANTTIYVEDKKEGIYHNIADGSYSFNASEEDAHDRFVIHFVPAVEFLANPVSCDGTKGALTLATVDNTNRNFEILTLDNALVSEGNVSNLSEELEAGYYSLNVYDAFGGMQTYEVEVEALPSVEADFEASNIEVLINEQVTFTNNTINASSLIWEVNGEIIEGLEFLTYSFDEPGIYSVKLTASNGVCEDISMLDVNVKAKVSSIVNIGEGTVQIFSNRNEVKLKFENVSESKADVQVYNMLGQMVLSDKVETVGTQTLNVINVTDGYYIVKMIQNGTVHSQKVLLTRK